MVEHFDRLIDDPISIKFMLDRFESMFDRLEGAIGLGGKLDRLGVCAID
jgi:hypothetical protein